MKTMTIHEYDQLVKGLMDELRTVKAERDRLLAREADLLYYCDTLTDKIEILKIEILEAEYVAQAEEIEAA